MKKNILKGGILFLTAALFFPGLSLPVFSSSPERDLDADGIEERALSNDSHLFNGYETFSDPNGNTSLILAKDGDSDGATDYFLDTDGNGQPDKYWDPDADFLSPVVIANVETSTKDSLSEYIYDSNNDQAYDRFYSRSFGVIRKEIISVDLQLFKSVPQDIYPGQTIQYEVAVKNSGSLAVAGIEVQNITLPSQLAYQSHSASQGSYSGSTWTVGRLNAGETATLAFAVLVDQNAGGTIADSASTIVYAPTSTATAYYQADQNAGQAVDASYWGEAAGDNNGFLRYMGDVNGDGYNDFGFISPNHDGSMGKVYLVFGKPTGWKKDTRANEVSASFNGEASFDKLWTPVDIGDINGDGIDDVGLFSNFNSQVGLDSGKTYIFFGKTSGWQLDVEVGTSCDASFLGEAAGDQLSYSGKFGDINNDGFDDLVMTGAYNDRAVSDAGKVYVVFGKASGWQRDVEIGTSSDASFLGEGNGDNLRAYNAINNFNGDSYSDLIIYSYNNDQAGNNAGQVYLVFGKASGWQNDVEIGTSSDASFLGEKAGESISFPEGLGDINFDGFGDLAITAYSNDESGADAGQVYLILGKAAGWQRDVELGTSSDASFLGEAAEDQLEEYSSIGSFDDVNGDGHKDFSLIAPHNDETNHDAGEMYVFFGRNPLPWGRDSEVGTSSDASFLGDGFHDRIRYPRALGDVNADGYNDFSFSSILNSAGAADAGQVYLFFGKESGWQRDVSVVTASVSSYVGEGAGDQLGYTTRLGDVNGDGYADFGFYANNNDEAANNAGQIYVVFGRESKKWLIDSDYSNNTASADIFVERGTTLSAPPSVPVPPPAVSQPEEAKKATGTAEGLTGQEAEIENGETAEKKSTAPAAEEIKLFYTDPVTKEKIDISNPAKVFEVMKQGLGATHKFITQTISFPARLFGRILLDVELHGEAYYINPDTKGKTYLGRPNEAFDIFKSLLK